MIRATAPSRLHFGLLALPGPDAVWPDADGRPTVPARRFGGAGLMIERPGVELVVRPATNWSVEGPAADRALSAARRVCASLQVDRPFHIHIERCAPEHVGLGTGTQLSLALARALVLAAARPELTAVELARHTGRGLRSALGIHGFTQGGFLIDGGKREEAGIAPLLCRLDFPHDWRVVLAIPRHRQGTHGPRELDAFARLAQEPPDLRQTEALCRLLLLGVAPALVQRDFLAFAEALHDYNRRAGEFFKKWQGGVYADPATGETIGKLRAAGWRCVGQSSWGPTIFVIAQDENEGSQACAWLCRHGFGANEVLLTRACGRGHLHKAGGEALAPRGLPKESSEG